MSNSLLATIGTLIETGRLEAAPVRLIATLAAASTSSAVAAVVEGTLIGYPGNVDAFLLQDDHGTISVVPWHAVARVIIRPAVTPHPATT